MRTLLSVGAGALLLLTVLKLLPIPRTGPLDAPKSLRQVGAPVDATNAAVPLDNPQTPEKIALGRQLFFDGRLSADGTVACSSCHDPARAFTDGRPTSIGIKERVGQRNAPTILNALYNKTQFWDGRVRTLEEQAELPIINPSEMGQPSLEAAVAKIAAIREYQRAFRRVFKRPPTGRDLLRAIASYERTQLSFDAPFDHFIAGDQNAIDDSAKRGWELFNTRARCNKCHALTETARDVTFFTDHDFHNMASASSDTMSSRSPGKPGSASDPVIRRPSIAPPFRWTSRRWAAFSSRSESAISPPSRRRACAICS